MMGDLEDIDLWQPAGQQQRIDVLLDVTGQQEAATRDRAEQHDGNPVDQRTVARGMGWDITAVRPQDTDRDVVHAEPVAGRQPESPGSVG
ncbi:MAG TPA: hypothetical protein VIH00_10730, partial [Candidatus Limnocylindrales bacterium]